MARPRRISNDQILAATRKAVVDHGATVSLDVIAQALGVTLPAVLKRYPSKEALFLAALQPPPTPPWVESLERGPDQRPVQAQLTELFEEVLVFFERIIPLMSALRECSFHFDHSRMRAGPIKGRAAWTAWLERAHQKGLIDAVDYDCAANAMIGALQARVFFSHVLQAPSPRRGRETFVETTAAFFSKALQVHKKPRRSPAGAPS